MKHLAPLSLDSQHHSQLISDPRLSPDQRTASLSVLRRRTSEEGRFRSQLKRRYCCNVGSTRRFSGLRSRRHCRPAPLVPSVVVYGTTRRKHIYEPANSVWLPMPSHTSPCSKWCQIVYLNMFSRYCRINRSGPYPRTHYFPALLQRLWPQS